LSREPSVIGVSWFFVRDAGRAAKGASDPAGLQVPGEFVPEEFFFLAEAESLILAGVGFGDGAGPGSTTPELGEDEADLVHLVFREAGSSAEVLDEVLELASRVHMLVNSGFGAADGLHYIFE